MAKTLQDLINEYNAKSGKAPIKSWKQKRSILEERVAKLDGTAPVESTQEPATEEVPAETQEKTVAKAKKAVKKVAKKTAKKAVKTNGASREGTLKAYVLGEHAKGKGNAEILAAAQAKGFETSYGTVASIRSRYGK